MAEENKNSNSISSPKTHGEAKIYAASYFGYSNQTFSSLNDFEKKLKLFQTDKEQFWQLESKKLDWIKPPEKIKTGKGNNSNWFVGSKSNITINCVDRHLSSENRNRAAIIWESEPGKNWILTYQLIYSYMNKIANTLKKLGLKKGNKVCIICGSLPETIFSVLACARIGVTFTILNPNISVNSLTKRFLVGNFDLLILADAVYRKGNLIEIKSKVDEALNQLSLNLRKLIFRRIKNYDLFINPEVDFMASDFLDTASDECKPISLENNFPLFSIIEYDENGNLIERFFPAAGFMVQTNTSSQYAFDFSSDDIFWCNSEFSSIAGVTYGIFAPLLNGISTFVYEGLPNYPSSDRTWKMINNYKITKLLIESYIVKALISSDSSDINPNDLSSLKLISVTGNPVNENEWEKIFAKVCGNKISLTYSFVSELIGGILFSDVPGITEIKTGSVNTNFPATDFDILNSDFRSVNNEEGMLVLDDSFPNFFKKNCYNLISSKDKRKFISSGYLAIRHKNKINILKRIDNKLDIAGEIVSLKEIQSVIEENPKVKSCKIDTKQDAILFCVPIAFIELNNPEDGTLLFKEELRNLVEQEISSAAKPIDIIFTD